MALAMIVSMPMTISPAGLAHLESFEGCIFLAKWDESGYALGFGHHGKFINEDSRCDAEQAYTWLEDDTCALSERISELVTVPLSQGHFDVLVIFAYNVGINAFAASHVLSRLNCGCYSDVPNQLARWIYAGGEVDPGLQARRANEIALWNAASAQEANPTQTA